MQHGICKFFSLFFHRLCCNSETANNLIFRKINFIKSNKCIENAT